MNHCYNHAVYDSTCYDCRRHKREEEEEEEDDERRRPSDSSVDTINSILPTTFDIGGFSGGGGSFGGGGATGSW